MMSRAFILLTCACIAAICCSGCTNVFAGKAGEWGQFSDDKDMVSAIKPGMRQTQVIERIGKPTKMTNGEMVYAGWAVWEYPTGTVTIYRGKVESVKVNPMSEKELLAIRETHQDYMDFLMHGAKDPKKLEEDKKRIAMEEDNEILKENDRLWNVKPYLRDDTKHDSSTPEGMME